MGRKVSPIAYRLGVLHDWKSRWFNMRQQRYLLEEDWRIREFFNQRASDAAIEKIEIQRYRNEIEIIIYTARPGLLIGRKGAKIKELEDGVKQLLRQVRKQNQDAETATLPKVKLEMQEVKEMESHAQLVARDIADQLERRLPFRRAMKQASSKIERYPNIKGVKIELSGRLGGAEMSRREWMTSGQVPLGSLRSDIDYGFAEAVTTYGTIGVKVWLNKGERFDV